MEPAEMPASTAIFHTDAFSNPSCLITLMAAGPKTYAKYARLKKRQADSLHLSFLG